MPNAKRHFNRSGKTAVAVLLIGLILLFDVMAAWPALHELIHHNSAAYDHQCAVKMFAHGKIEPSNPEIRAVSATVMIETIPHVAVSVFSPVIKNLPQGRAPPAMPVFPI